MRKRQVLFVDDEKSVLTALQRALNEEPYEVLLANGANEALEILEKKDINVLVTDLQMPGKSGFELLQKVKEEYPYIIRMILTGHMELNSVLRAINEGHVFRYILKPWKSNDEIKSIVRQAIEYYDLHTERELLMTLFEQYIQGHKPEEIKVDLIQTILDERDLYLYEWGVRRNTKLLSKAAVIE